MLYTAEGVYILDCYVSAPKLAISILQLTCPLAIATLAVAAAVSEVLIDSNCLLVCL